MRFFEPIPIPPGPKTQRSVMFDKSSDISGNSVFSGLQQYGPSKVEVGETGRVNPFTPLSPPIKTTSTATSTKAVIDSDVKATTETTGTAMEAI